MPVETPHPEYTYRLPDWTKVADCVAGQRVIKAKGATYLPLINPADTSPENKSRNDVYRQRAVFANFTATTVSNMQGQCFAVDPVYTAPDQMSAWEDDVDGAGMDAIQQSKKALAYVLQFSRAALWVDYPETNGAVSLADVEEGGIRPRCILYDPRDIINWRYTQVGGKTKLALVVIKEQVAKEDDGFEIEYETQYRVLRLVNGVYVQELHKTEGAGKPYTLAKTIIPNRGDAQGMPFDEIPFTFLGAEANDPTDEKPLLLDIADLNVAHYIDSADYQEIVFLVGQPTLWMSGLTDEWVKNILKGGVMLGSRKGLALPQDAACGLLQPEQPTLAKEAMDQKQQLVVALNGRLVEKREVQKTATEAGINEAAETSILAGCCNNVSKGYSKAFRWMAIYANITVADPEKEILFELNTDFAVSRMSPEEMNGIISLEGAGLITWEEARDKLKKGGVAYLDDEDAKDEIEEKQEEALAKAGAELELQTKSAIEIQKAKGDGKPAPNV